MGIFQMFVALAWLEDEFRSEATQLLPLADAVSAELQRISSMS